MRVTENTSYETVRGSIRRSRERMENLQNQSATLKKLNTPSDDPIGASKVMEIRTNKVNNDQFQVNGKMAEMFLGNTDHALGELTDIIVRTKEIALGQSSRASSTELTRLGVAEEVSRLYDQAVAVANTRIGERYLFGGYKTQTQPVDAEGHYQGDAGQMMTEIGKGVFLAMNVPGVEVFNSKHVRSSDTQNQEPIVEHVNLFEEIQNLRMALLTGNVQGIHQTLERFDQIHAKITGVRAQVGSRMHGLQNIMQSGERHNLVNAQLSSALEDADMAQVVSDLAKEETVFRSALASSQKLIQPSLLEFLK